VTLPKPEIGLVVHYSYLWANEHAGGAEEGIKNRPCAIVAATRSVEGRIVATVFPITHTPPSDPRDAVELPARLKRHLGLDGERSWVVVTEFNRFVWPGVDLQPRPGVTPRRYDYGVIPGKFMARVIEVFDSARRARRVAPVVRTE
jgi:hypothetical protein